jgi:hypothetical protein
MRLVKVITMILLFIYYVEVDNPGFWHNVRMFFCEMLSKIQIG